MRYLVSLVVLLASSWLLCEARASDRPSPIKLINDKLETLASECNASTTLKIAVEYDWESEPEFSKSSSFRKAVQALRSLETDDYCTADVATGFSTLMSLGTEEDGIDKPPSKTYALFRTFNTLTTALYVFKTEEIGGKCFNKFEEKWKNNPWTDVFERDFPELTCLGELLTNRSERLFSNGSEPNEFLREADLRQLSGAIELNTNPNSERNKLNSSDIRSALCIPTTDTEKMSKDEATQVINERLVMPCKELRERAEVETFFKHISSIGTRFWMTDSFKSFKSRGSDFKSILWTARYIFCETFLTKIDRKKLASEMALDPATMNIKSTLRGCLSSALGRCGQ